MTSGTGLPARCLQHETDHLNGTVFGDRLPARARKKLYQSPHEELAELYPADWPVSPKLPSDDDEDEDEPDADCVRSCCHTSDVGLGRCGQRPRT